MEIFLKYFRLTQIKHIKSKYPEYEYGSNICDDQDVLNNYNASADILNYEKNIGGWMIMAMYYDSGMWHFWTNKVKENICNAENDILGLILHCDHDLQEIDASFEYLKIFECNDNKKNMVMKNVIHGANHMVVYDETDICVLQLVDKIYLRYINFK